MFLVFYLIFVLTILNAGAVPKQILKCMQEEKEMDVGGLTRNNVASHLQVGIILLYPIQNLYIL